MTTLTQSRTDTPFARHSAKNYTFLRVVAAGLALGVAYIHVRDQGGFPGDKSPTYIALGYYLLEAAGVGTAIALLFAPLRHLRRVWTLAIGVALGPLAGYVLSRGPWLAALHRGQRQLDRDARDRQRCRRGCASRPGDRHARPLASRGEVRTGPVMSMQEAAPSSRKRMRRRVRPASPWWRDAVAIACWASGRSSLSLCGSPAADCSHSARRPADVLTSLGRLTGLIAADLLLIQVFLMARVPMIERSYGQDELARRHRLVGFWSFNLMVLHVVLITVGYSLGAAHRRAARGLDAGHDVRRDAARARRDAGTDRRGRHVGDESPAGRCATSRGTCCTSTPTSASACPCRTRSGPGADFTTSPLVRVYWWTIYAVAAGAILLFRVGLPLWRTLRHGITVTSVVRESPDVVTVRMGGRGLHRLPVQAGQFFIWRFLDGPGWSRGNPYSLSAAPRLDRVQITAKDLGDGSNRLARLRPGTKVLLEGPYGRLTGEHRVGSKVAMLACGIGITPMRALLEDLAYAPGDAVLIYRARSEPDLVFRAELDQLAQRRGITIHYLDRAAHRRSELVAAAERSRVARP